MYLGESPSGHTGIFQVVEKPRANLMEVMSLVQIGPAFLSRKHILWGDI